MIFRHIANVYKELAKDYEEACTAYSIILGDC
jgi:hypothetical protein